VGRTLGKDYTEIIKSSGRCTKKELKLIIHFVASCVVTNTYISEIRNEANS